MGTTSKIEPGRWTAFVSRFVGLTPAWTRRALLDASNESMPTGEAAVWRAARLALALRREPQPPDGAPAPAYLGSGPGRAQRWRRGPREGDLQQARLDATERYLCVGRKPSASCRCARCCGRKKELQAPVYRQLSVKLLARPLRVRA